MQTKKNFISYFFLITFAVLLFPKDLLHDWTGHHDTIDKHCISHSPLGIENEHTHCDFLKLTAPDFCDNHKQILVSVPCTYFIFQEKSDCFYFSGKYNIHFLRGPPAFIC
jgi:hypothetical protein